MNKVLSKNIFEKHRQACGRSAHAFKRPKFQHRVEGYGFLSCGIHQVTPERCISHTSLMSQTTYQDLEGGNDPGMC